MLVAKKLMNFSSAKRLFAKTNDLYGYFLFDKMVECGYLARKGKGTLQNYLITVATMDTLISEELFSN